MGRITLIALATIFASSLALAQSSKKATASDSKAASTKGAPAAAAPAEQPKSDKLDISDLEQKYWAPKDTDFNVVQNRTYTKAKRFAASLFGGPIMNDPYSIGYNYGIGLNYYFDDRSGVEFQYFNCSLGDSKMVEAFRSRSGTSPDYNRWLNYMGFNYNWIPIYAKASLLNKNIVYFDLAISPGVGMVNYTQKKETGDVSKSSPAIALDISQHFFLNKNFSLRVDWKARWYQEEVLRFNLGGRPESQRVLSTDFSNTSFLMFGFTYYH